MKTNKLKCKFCLKKTDKELKSEANQVVECAIPAYIVCL